MPDKCVLRYRCGTKKPGWLSGAHPTVGEGVVIRKVCYSEEYKCCNWFQKIKMKNCGTFYVYELHKPPICPLRYCGNAGTGKLNFVGFFIFLIQQLRYQNLAVVKLSRKYQSCYAFRF